MHYFICARCNHITKQKIEMKRHLDKINNCQIKDITNTLTDEQLYNKSLERIEKLLDKNSNKKNDLQCKKCNKCFSNKSNVRKHIKNVCSKKINKIKELINNIVIESNKEDNNYNTSDPTEEQNIIKNSEKNITNIQNIGVQNITNKIININLGSSIKGFDQDWDTTTIDHKKKGEILLSNSKYTKTLENILKNELNLNVIMDDEDNTGVVYINDKNKYEPMTKKEIIEKSMKKVYNHLKDFYKEIINNNTDDLSVKSLENELEIFEKKYRDFMKFEDAKNIVNNAFSKLYTNKKEEAETKYYDFVNNNLTIENANDNINNILLDEY